MGLMIVVQGCEHQSCPDPVPGNKYHRVHLYGDGSARLSEPRALHMCTHLPSCALPPRRPRFLALILTLFLISATFHSLL